LLNWTSATVDSFARPFVIACPASFFRFGTKPKVKAMKRPVSRAVRRLLLLAAMPAILTACAADNEPSPMPTGYKYTNIQQYRVPVTGPERTMQYPGMNAVNGMQPSAAEMATPMGAPPMQDVTSTSTMTSTTQTSQAAAIPLTNMVNAAPPAPPPPPAQALPPAPPPMMAPPPMAPTPMPPPPPMPVPMPPEAAAMPSPAMATPQWQNAAEDLLGKAEVRFGRLRDPVYVRDAAPGQPGENEFRAALLQTMAREHYKIAPAADKAPFTFDYSLSGQPNGEETITLKTVAEGREASRVTGMYNMAAPGAEAMAPATAPATAPMMVPATSPAASMPSVRPPMPAAQTTPMQPVPWGSASPSSEPAAPAGPTASAAPMYQAQPPMQTEPSAIPPVPTHAPASANDDAAPETSTTTTSSDQTYVYDGRAMNAPGKTAYEQLHGTDHQVDAGSQDDGAADH
jgi:hypothetical protein